MRKIRIGNDIAVQWSLVAKGTGEPFVVEGKDIRLSLKSIFATTEIEDFTAQGNTIAWTFKGAEQKQTGIYSLVVSVVDAQGAMVTTDVCQFVELVACSCEADGADEAGVQTESIDLVSNVDITSGTTNPSEVMLLIEELQNTKIDKEADDYYPQLSVGTADNLSGVDEVDSEFSFRRSGGGAIADGVARVQSIKGNSVVWNNIFKPFADIEEKPIAGDITYIDNGIKITNWLEYNAFRTNVGLSNKDGHKTLLLLDYTNDNPSQLLFIEYAGYESYYYSPSSIASFITINIDQNYEFKDYISLFLTEPSSGAITITNMRIVDLTQMFGAGNEPSTIEEYNARKPFVEDEYAYNEGEVIHTTAEGISSKGVNAWDEEWRNGYIHEGTVYENSATGIISKNHIRVLPDTQYSCTIGSAMSYATISYYDKEKKYIGQETLGNSRTFKTPTNCRYILFFVEGMPTYNHDICIGISGDWDGYHAPIEASEDLSIVAKYFPNGMRSAGAAHDEIRYNKASGKWEKVVRIGSVDMGTLYWELDGGTFYTVDERYFAKMGLLSSRYTNITSKDESMNMYAVNGILRAFNSAYTDAASFKAAMAGVILYYELAEPIVTEIKEKDFNLDYKVWNCGTEQMVASKPSSALSADITYGFNAVGLIKQLRSMIAALSAKVANL